MFDFLNLALLGLQDPLKMGAMMAAQNIAPETMAPAIGAMAQPIAANSGNDRPMPTPMAVDGAANAGAMAPGGNIPQAAVPMANGAGASPIQQSGPGVQVASLDNSIFDGFMNTVKTQVTNPNGLAAIAATGQRETRFSAGNAFRTWNDGANDAGGIMSWNGPRLKALQNFAGTSDMKAISPEIQAQYFLQEDPSLISKLNAAGSPREAMSLMNNAWAFKGFDNPDSPEFKARFETVDKIAPLFSGGTANQTPGTGDMNVAEAVQQMAADKAKNAEIMASLGVGGPGEPFTAASGAQSVPLGGQTLADKLAAVGKGLKVPEGSGPQEPPKITGGLGPNVGGGFGRDPQSIEKLFALLGGNVPAQTPVPSLAALIKGGLQ